VRMPLRQLLEDLPHDLFESVVHRTIV